MNLQFPPPSRLFSPSYPRRETLDRIQKRRRRNILIIIGFLLLLVLITVLEVRYLHNPSLAIAALFSLNLTLILLLVLLIFRNVFKLFAESRSRHGSSRFRVKLILGFVILTMVPTVFLAIIGSNLIADSIKDWFNPRLEDLVGNSMEVARFTLTSMEDSMKRVAESIAADARSAGQGAGHAASRFDPTLIPQRFPDLDMLFFQVFDQARSEELYRSIEEPALPEMVIDPHSGLLSSTMEERTSSRTLIGTDRDFLQMSFRFDATAAEPYSLIVFVNIGVPPVLSQKLRAIQSDYNLFKQQKRAIRPSQGIYVSVFVLIALTVLFAAIWLALYLARHISIPISHLAMATHEVARGNLDFKLDVLAYDEIAELVESFNQMTDQLKTNRRLIDQTTEQIRKTNLEIESRRNQLETLLENLTAGVISLTSTGEVSSLNTAGRRFLGILGRDYLGKAYSDVFHEAHLREFVTWVDRAFSEKSRGFQKEISIQFGKHLQVCSVSFASLIDSQGTFSGLVIVLDDLSQFLRIQRIAAWREVARNLAHEIKNPLTPIQLNAQRLQRKFDENAQDFPSIFRDAITSIIGEVNSIRKLLDEFSQFARMPDPNPRLANLHDIISQTIALFAGSHDRISFRLELDASLPKMMVDPEQIKRAMINLIDNAIDAMSGEGSIVIRTEHDRTYRMVRLTVADSGRGIPPGDRDKLFLPYFSTKERGSGLGLAIVNRIVSDHDGTIRAVDNDPVGTMFVLELPIQIPVEGRGQQA